MLNFHFYYPARIVFDNGRIANRARVLILVGGTGAKKTGALQAAH